MVNLKRLKDLFSNPPQDFTTKTFIEIHEGVEAYFRRLLIIGLRLNQVQYNTSIEVIRRLWTNNPDLLKNLIYLISFRSKSLNDFQQSNPDFKELLELFFDFTSRYRNLIVHGVDDKIHDPTTLKYLILTDYYLIIEFEETLKMLGFKSAFEKPKEWGATISNRKENVKDVIKRLKIGDEARRPIDTQIVFSRIKKTKYSGKF